MFELFKVKSTWGDDEDDNDVHMSESVCVCTSVQLCIWENNCVHIQLTGQTAVSVAGSVLLERSQAGLSSRLRHL